MKSAMPYLGVPTPPLRRTCRDLFTRHPLEDFASWHDTVLALWRGATHREHRYAAIELAGARRYAAMQTLRALPMYEEMIVSGAWWDYVDALAHRLGDILRRDGDRTKSRLRLWGPLVELVEAPGGDPVAARLQARDRPGLPVDARDRQGRAQGVRQPPCDGLGRPMLQHVRHRRSASYTARVALSPRRLPADAGSATSRPCTSSW
jgi:hypothetical protein